MALGYRHYYEDKMIPADTYETFTTDRLFYIPTRQVTKGQKPFAYQYEFSWESSKPALGSCHILEIGFVFNNLDKPDLLALTGEKLPQKLADQMQ